MNQWIYASRNGIRVGSQIGFAIKERVRAHPSYAALFEKVNQRVAAAAGLRVTEEIVIGVEQRMGLSAFGCAVLRNSAATDPRRQPPGRDISSGRTHVSNNPRRFRRRRRFNLRAERRNRSNISLPSLAKPSRNQAGKTSLAKPAWQKWRGATVSPLRPGRLVCRAFLGLVLTARRAAAALERGHPSRRASAALSASARQPLQRQNRFLNLFTFLAQVRQHFQYIHSD